MLDIELIALLEEDLNEYLQEQEQKETDQHKTHSSSVVYTATELQTAEPEIGAKIKYSAQNEPHIASHDPQVGPAPELESATSNQEMKLFGLEEQLRILIAENPEYVDDGKKNSTTASQCDEAGLQCEYTQNGSSVDVQTDCKLGANQKRNSCEADLDFNKPQHPHLQSNIIPTLFPTDELFPRTHSEVAGQPPRIQEPQALYALSEVGHEFTTMLGGSPGRKRKHNALNKEPSSPQEATEDAESSPTIGKSEIADSQEDYVGLFLYLTLESTAQGCGWKARLAVPQSLTPFN
jgi:hypothetical protein